MRLDFAKCYIKTEDRCRSKGSFRWNQLLIVSFYDEKHVGNIWKLRKIKENKQWKAKYWTILHLFVYAFLLPRLLLRVLRVRVYAVNQLQKNFYVSAFHNLYIGIIIIIIINICINICEFISKFMFELNRLDAVKHRARVYTPHFVFVSFIIIFIIRRQITVYFLL